MINYDDLSKEIYDVLKSYIDQNTENLTNATINILDLVKKQTDTHIEQVQRTINDTSDVYESLNKSVQDGWNHMSDLNESLIALPKKHFDNFMRIIKK